MKNYLNPVLDVFLMAGKINDLIFKELIKRGYSLRGNTRVWNIADSKLWYLTPKQARAYLDLENSNDYNDQMFRTEIKMLEEFMPGISEKVLCGSAINVIDIGCGDGKKAVPTIEALHKSAKLRYCPIDISSYMVTRAIEKVGKMNKSDVVNFRWNISDFDNLENVAALLRDNEFRQNFLLFLGSTISNFEIHEVMYEIVEAMNSEQDYLLMGVALSNVDTKDLVKSYKMGYMRDFLSLTITGLGLSKDDVEFDVRYENSRIEMFFVVKNDKTLVFEDKKVNLYEGDQIVVAFSYRYNEEQLRKIMDIYFDEYKFYFNEDRSWVLALCKK